MNRCTRCVIPNTRPDTAFVDGVCSACLSFAKRPTVDWDARKKELVALLDRHDGRCIVPSSGGKDSTYQVLTLLSLGADVTVVTATTCHLTRIGRRNIANLAKHARTVEISPNKKVRAKLNRLGLQLVGDISWPEHASIFSAPFRYATSYGIPLIFYGENPQSQYGGPLGSEEARQMTRRWTQEFGGFLGLRPSDLVGMEGITERDMQDYELPSREAMDRVGVEAHFLGQYIPWDSHQNAEVAMGNGMEVFFSPTTLEPCPPCNANWWPWENLDNAQTGLHDHLMYLKYSYGRGAAQISVDIRSGRISREEALKWVKENDGQFPNVYAGVHIEEVLERIKMKRPQLQTIMDRFTNWVVLE
jgi:N-acetyl sugar amidotransferase